MSELLGRETAMKATRLDAMRPLNVTMPIVLPCRSTFGREHLQGVSVATVVGWGGRSVW